MSNKMQWSDKVDGRPPKYTKTTFAQKVQEYLEHMKTGDEGRLVTKIWFCVYAGVDKDYVNDHDIRDGSKGDFSRTVKLLNTHAEASLIKYGTAGKIPPAMAIFLLKNNHEYVDKREHTGAGGTELMGGLNIQVIQTPQFNQLIQSANDSPNTQSIPGILEELSE